MAHGLHLAQHRSDAPSVVTSEVAAHALAQVGRLADVQHLVAVAAEHVHARGARQLGGHRQLGGLRVPGQLGERHEVVEPEHPQPGGALDEVVQQVGRCERVVECPVGRLVVEPQAIGERREAAVGHVVAQQPAGEGGGVDDGRAVVGALVAGERGAQETEVERRVVGDEHATPEEVEQACRARSRCAARGRRPHR